MTTSVTVVIPNWNGEAFLPAVLSSLAAQVNDGLQVDVLVVDNGSTDRSRDIVESWVPSTGLVALESNLGFAEACNRGARESSATYIAFLNNDARVDHAWLVELARFLDGNPDAAVAGSLVLDWDGRTVDFAGSGLSGLARGIQLDFGKPRSAAPQEPTRQLFVNGAAMLVRREVFLDAGGFDPRFFAYYEDVDLGWRMWVKGWDVVLVPSSVVYHRHHGTGVRLRRDQVELLLTRNALMTVVKNLGDSRLAAYLPILLLAEADRLRTMSNVDAANHRPPGVDSLALSARVNRPERHQRARGLRQLLAGLYRRDLVVRENLARAIARTLAPRAAVMSTRAAAIASALTDLLDAWPELMSERARIQATRRRTDDEILPLFRLEEQRRKPRSDRLLANDTLAAVIRAMEAAALGDMTPSGR